ncbi:MAG: NifB/NifX family molybdenum-iron cluster-binding protein [Sulfurimonas sp.]|nr:NifB/NifX family molybdenum-iron cluster-binding protein [Sulfurimonas sp.]
MIAIPVDTATTDAESSKLFGNVKMFAIYEPKEKRFFFIKNEGVGNGIKTAKLLKQWDVKSTVYSYMGDGPFKALQQDNIDVYYIGKEPMALEEIVKEMQKSSFIKVDATNASTYLDSGTNTGSCKCGCTHE